ncbi:Uncharacterised protein [Raoultella terrigena]|uniref:Uncharacterized protein n=1 Tax=Raoultella terrigena TaxID=577 RepID=A0A3P8M067_RAOTE|nr:Uncharacterised protein [Raoultella terrigena]
MSGRSGLAQVSLENLLEWQPDIIPHPAGLDAKRDFTGSRLAGRCRRGAGAGSAARRPAFGWLDAPPGINRLAGMRRLHAWLDPQVRATLQEDLTRYSTLFWHAALTPERYTRLMNRP